MECPNYHSYKLTERLKMINLELKASLLFYIAVAKSLKSDKILSYDNFRLSLAYCAVHLLPGRHHLKVGPLDIVFLLGKI